MNLIKSPFINITMKYIFLFVLLIHFPVFSQINCLTKSSAEIIQEAYSIQQEEKYINAIDLYSKINVNDTNYVAAQFEASNCMMALKDYEGARKLLRKLISDDVKTEFRQDIYNSIGLSYAKEGDSLNAVQAYTEGLSLFPMDFRMYYNRALAYETLNKYQEAYEDYKKSIQRNIYFAPAHYRLGVLAAHEEHYAEATMSILTYLYIEPTGKNASSIIIFLESIADGTFNPEPKGIVFSESNPFESVNLLYKNKVALEKKYKTKFTIPGAFPNQLHFVVNNAKIDPEDKDFWNQMYLPFFQKINTDGKLDPFVLLTIVSIDNESLQKKLAANISKIKAFIDYARPIYTELHAQQYFEYEGEIKKVYMSYEDQHLNAFGPLDSDNLPHGNFYYYHPNGSLMLKAKYEHNVPVDKFEFYSATNGKKYKEIEFTDGTENKIERLYYYSGELKEMSTIKNGIVVDTVYEYYRNGSIKQRIAVGNNTRNGESLSYFANGTISEQGNYKEGKGNGKFSYYHRNGQLASEQTYVNDLKEGKITNYYPDGKIASTYEIKANKYNGPYEEFHANGKTSEKGTYKNGFNVTELTTYFTDGTLKNSTKLDDNGKENGSSTLYDIDGKKYTEIQYVSGDIKSVTFFDKNGNSKVISEKKGKKLNYQILYPTGELNVEGKFEDGLRTGLWSYYDRYGNKFKQEKYVAGVLSDTLITYHENGQIHEIVLYKDGERNGMYLNYNIYGDLTEEGYFKNDNYDREQYSYYQDGTLSEELYYMNGEQHGIQLYYATNGKLKMMHEYDEGLIIRHNYYDTLGNVIDLYSEYNGEVELHDPSNAYVNYFATYLNGEANGTQTFYGPNKIVLSKGNYVNNYKTGKWQWYHANGKLSEESNFINGLIQGVSTEYYLSGKPSYVANFEYGDAQGPFKWYHENGKIQLEGNYLDDERHGIVTSYSPDGSVILIRNYRFGVVTSYSYLGPDGKALPFIPITKSADSIVTYHKNKHLAIQSKRPNGLIDGLYLTYYENGQVYEKEYFKYGNNDGLALNYYPDGKIMLECNYLKGVKHGTEKKYFANGKLQSEQKFLNGVAHGELKEYSMEGKLISTTTYYDGEIISIKK